MRRPKLRRKLTRGSWITMVIGLHLLSLLQLRCFWPTSLQAQITWLVNGLRTRKNKTIQLNFGHTFTKLLRLFSSRLFARSLRNSSCVDSLIRHSKMCTTMCWKAFWMHQSICSLMWLRMEWSWIDSPMIWMLSSTSSTAPCIASRFPLISRICSFWSVNRTWWHS